VFVRYKKVKSLSVQSSEDNVPDKRWKAFSLWKHLM